MGQVADTSLRALVKEKERLHYPLWLQRYLFFRKAKGVHGVHSPLAFRLATEVFMREEATSLETRLEVALADFSFQSIALEQLADGLHFLRQKPESAVWVKGLDVNRANWLAACEEDCITLAIDCFFAGLLLRTEWVKEKQYLRQKTVESSK